jgi:hypothetical protein
MRLITLVLIASAALPSSSLAQPPAPPAGGDRGQGPATPSNTTVDVSRLGVSLDRIKRQLAPPPEETSEDGPLRLSFSVQVIGQAPKIDLLQGFSLNGPMAYGAPTHREVLDVVTPQAYRSPVIPFSALTYWAAQKLWMKTKKERCEEELAAYKKLVMSGVAVAAPRCSQ